MVLIDFNGRMSHWQTFVNIATLLKDNTLKYFNAHLENAWTGKKIKSKF